jgi:hypothetical protein
MFMRFRGGGIGHNTTWKQMGEFQLDVGLENPAEEPEDSDEPMEDISIDESDEEMALNQEGDEEDEINNESADEEDIIEDFGSDNGGDNWVDEYDSMGFASL